MSQNQYCVVLTTFSEEEVGSKIIQSLLEKKLAACIQVQEIQSYYRWKGKVTCDAEKLLLIKTKQSLYFQVEADILCNHNYEIPEIMQLPIHTGFAAYLNWIDDECN